MAGLGVAVSNPCSPRAILRVLPSDLYWMQ
jgi:hypothetical protein